MLRVGTSALFPVLSKSLIHVHCQYTLVNFVVTSADSIFPIRLPKNLRIRKRVELAGLRLNVNI